MRSSLANQPSCRQQTQSQTAPDTLTPAISHVRARAFLLAFVVAAAAIRLFFWWYTQSTWEDALTTTLHSENFHSGLGLTLYKVDDPAPIHGFTSPISVLIPLVGDWFQIGFGITLQKIFSVLTAMLSVMYGYRLLSLFVQDRLLVPASIFGCGYIAFEFHQILYGMSGMESQVAVAILLASMYYLATRRTIALGLSLALCLYARPDFVFWVAIAVISFSWFCWRERHFKSPLIAAVLVFVIYVPWLIFTTYYYGSPIPNTVIAKTAGYPSPWQDTQSFLEAIKVFGGIVLRGILAPLGPSFGGNGTGFAPLAMNKVLLSANLLLILAGFIGTLVKRQRQALPMYAFVAASVLFHVFWVPWVFGWYTVPITAVCALLAAKGLADIFSLLSPRAAIWGSMTASVALLLPFIAVLPATFNGQFAIQKYVENDIRTQIGLYIRQIAKPYQSIGGEPLGYIGYYSRVPYYDYPGLCSRRVTKIVKQLRAECGRCPKWTTVMGMMRVMSSIRPDFLVLRGKELAAFRREADGQFVDRDYREDRWFRISEEGKSKLLFPERNQDTEYVVLKKIDHS
jgi:hypothetical protein